MLVDTINELCIERLGRKPDLDNPRGFNDLIQWLKIYDQRQEHITACDKWAVRKMVRAKADCLVPARLGISIKWPRFVLKCTHDCGSVQFVNEIADLEPAQAAIKEYLQRPYGIEKGEWAYQFIEPHVMTEKWMGDLPDYKFHCAHGRVKWCQVIRDRRGEEGPRETILAPDGNIMAMHMDQNMRHTPNPAAYPGDEAWRALTALAETLAAGWRYVRVDLYWTRGKAWFGELTFWPLAGCYLTPDEPAFGEMLELDLTETRKPIVE